MRIPIITTPIDGLGFVASKEFWERKERIEYERRRVCKV